MVFLGKDAIVMKVKYIFHGFANDMICMDLHKLTMCRQQKTDVSLSKWQKKLRPDILLIDVIIFH